MEAAKEQSGPFRFNQSLGRRDSGSPQDRIIAIAAMAETISGNDPRRKKGQGDPSLRLGLCAGGSVPGVGSADYTSCETGLKQDSQRKLHGACRLSCRNHTEIRVAQCVAGRIEVRMVQNVEKLAAELRTPALAELEVLGEGHIHGLPGGAAKHRAG